LPLLEASVPGVLRMRSIDGTDRLVGYTPPTAENHRLAAVVGFHEPELMGNLKGTLLRSAMLLALVTVLATVLTLLVARRFITQPTRALLDVARRWSRGELDARAPAWDRGSEFGQMALAYNEMAAALQRREEELRGHAVGLEVAVAERTRALTRANERLQSEMKEHRTTETALLQAQKVQAVGQLAGGIAHDFNNILQAVLGGITLIRRRAGDTEDVTRLAGMIEDSARRGESITRRLLAFSRREELRAEALDLSELLEGLHEVLSATLGSRISVEVEAGEGLRPVFADRGQLETVLVNLATNARDAMPAGGTLTLSAVKEHVEGGEAGLRLATGCYVRLSVTDTGEGMDAETLARAAEPFFTTKPLGRGTGLGLAMARSFAHGSGGEIAIASVAGAGTTVSLWLPLVAKRPSAAEPAAAGDGGALPVGGRAPRILLVDDETMVREVLAAQLEDAGYEVTQGEDGASALRLLETEDRFDLLVTDLAMPGLDGVALVGEARRRQPGLPAILVTGYAGDVAPLASDVSGGFVLLRKPVGGTELAMQVARLLAEAAERQPDAVMDVATG
jgi:signal transduction histidine kinase/ActR/RegA family two-component response regulator